MKIATELPLQPEHTLFLLAVNNTLEQFDDKLAQPVIFALMGQLLGMRLVTYRLDAESALQTVCANIAQGVAYMVEQGD